MEEQFFDANHPVEVPPEPEPIIEFSPTIEQEILKMKRALACTTCGKLIPCKVEDGSFDYRIMKLHVRREHKEVDFPTKENFKAVVTEMPV